jgi:hypothetical protein
MSAWQQSVVTPTVIAAAAISIGLLGGGYMLGDGLRRAKTLERTVSVRGVAERNVTADQASWTLSFAEEEDDLATAQAKIDRDSADVTKFLRAAGFPASAIADSGGSISKSYDREHDRTSYRISRSIQLRTKDVMRAQQAYARQFDLIRQGVAMQDESNVQYTFTGLSGIKPDMIAEATADARRGAERFAANSGAGVGGMKSASQGYFSISPRDGDSGEEGGGSGSQSSPYQKVRVVTSIDYYLS